MNPRVGQLVKTKYPRDDSFPPCPYIGIIISLTFGNVANIYWFHLRKVVDYSCTRHWVENHFEVIS